MDRKSQILRSDYEKVEEVYMIDGKLCIQNFDLGRNMTKYEIENGVVFNEEREMITE